MGHWLFVYGTLKDLAVHRILFGSVRPSAAAVLNDWNLYLGQDGYLFVKPHPGGQVVGLIIQLSDAHLQVCDRWEDVPFYRREPVWVRATGATDKKVWVYTRRGRHGRAFRGNTGSIHPPHHVWQAARRLRHGRSTPR